MSHRRLLSRPPSSLTQKPHAGTTAAPTQHHTAGARVALSSHLGRPKDGPEDKFSLGPVAERLTELLGKECKMAPDCVGDEVAEIANGLGDGDVMLLENVRFYPAETKNDAGELHRHALIFMKIVGSCAR